MERGLSQVERFAKVAEVPMKGLTWSAGPMGRIDPELLRAGQVILPEFKKIMGEATINFLGLLADINEEALHTGSSRSYVELRSRRLLRVDYDTLGRSDRGVIYLTGGSMQEKEANLVREALELGLIGTRPVRGTLNIGFKSTFYLTELGYALNRAWEDYLGGYMETRKLTDNADVGMLREALAKMPEVLQISTH